jgi:GT2 family glycosyltransferase
LKRDAWIHRQLQPRVTDASGDRVVRLTAVVVNFNTALYTRRCVASLVGSTAVARIVVVDNGSRGGEREELEIALAPLSKVELIALPTNLGFAGGSNVAIASALAEPDCDAVLFLNSDAELLPESVEALVAGLGEDARIGLIGGRVDKPSGKVDSLGIAFYASCLASNRMVARDRYFGPTGSCAIYRRNLLERLLEAHGHVFDDDFFCYAEDTDVAARALLLGFEPAFVDRVVAHHEGQVSSGGGFSDFVLYHGIRNSIWMMLKCVPGPVLLLCSPLIAVLHVGIVVRHGVKGKFGVLRALYVDALRGAPGMLRKRRRIQATRCIGSRGFLRFLTPRVYDADYLSSAVRELFTRRQKPVNDG